MKVDLLDRVSKTIKKYDMIKEGERLLVGLSGGADSVALLLCLNKLGFGVSALHVNHCLRGEESDGDQRFCEELCKRLGIPLTVKRIDVISYCKANSLSTEEGARVLRYKAFYEAGLDKICTAHNLDDCLETAVFNLARGSGLKGVSSIPPVRDNVIRPLIECSRGEIEQFLADEGQSFVTDSTNLTDDYSRNKIRHRVLPELKNINSSLLATYRRTAEYLRQDSAFLEALADKALEECRVNEGSGGFAREKLMSLEYPVKRRVIMRLLEENGVSASSELVELTDRLISEGGKLNVKENCFAATRSSLLYFYKEQESESEDKQLNVPENGEVEWQGRKIIFKIIEIDGKFENVNKKFANSCLDYDKIIGELVLRQRKAGDKLRLVSRDFSSDVRMLLKQAFKAHERSSAVILADSEGVVMVEGYGCAQRVKIDESTKKVLVFYCE